MPIGDENLGGDIDQYAKFILGEGRHEFRGSHTTVDSVDAWEIGLLPESQRITAVELHYVRDDPDGSARALPRSGSISAITALHQIPPGPASVFIDSAAFLRPRPKLPTPELERTTCSRSPVSDTIAPAAFWAVFVTVEGPTPPPLEIRNITGLQRRLVVFLRGGKGLPDTDYDIEYSTDLVNWIYRATVTTPTGMASGRRSIQRLSIPRGYYRAVEP